jgi:hypothetical protein
MSLKISFPNSSRLPDSNINSNFGTKPYISVKIDNKITRGIK